MRNESIRTISLDGNWSLKDSAGLADARLVLCQNEERIWGAAYYKAGTAVVEGDVREHRFYLKIIYDNPKVLLNWVGRNQVNEVLGITSRYEVIAVPVVESPLNLAGPYQGFFVRFRSNGEVTEVWDSDRPGIENVWPPRLAHITKIESNGAS